MPKETFFNLPEEKRQRIFQVALEEFAAHPYRQVSVNRIVRRAGIPKGSFYQYFGDKRDLFFYLLQRAGEIKMRYLAPALQQAEQYDFFTLLRELYLHGLRMAEEHPLYVALGKRLLEDRVLYAELLAESVTATEDFFRHLLERAQARGEIRRDLDFNLVLWLVTLLNAQINEYYLTHVSAEYGQQMLEVVDQLIAFLRHGLAGNTPSGRREP